MLKPLWLTLLTLIALPVALIAAHPAAHPAQAAEVRLAIVKTARHKVQENLLFAGGDSARQLDVNFSAFLVQHGDTLLMFDTGPAHDSVSQDALGYFPNWVR